MGEIKITLYGRIPSKKNSKQIITRGKKRFLIPSEHYKLWHEAQGWQLKKVKIKGINNCKIEMVFYPPDKRTTDLTNKAESVMDLLVDNQILVDDNWFICPDIHLKAEQIDRENSRVEIKIKYF